jgi:hypothetical protein
MAIDASALLGSPQVAGVKVNPRGMAKRVAGNQVGRATARVVLGASDTSPSQTPDFGRNAFLAVTADDLALVRLNSGLVTFKLDEILARVPRRDVTSVELGDGLVSGLTIDFRNGDRWQLEVPRPSRKHAQEVVRALGK